MLSSPPAASSIIQPPSSLLIPVTNPQTNQSDYAFPLQTSAWLKMQDVVRQALAFPLTMNDFKNNYGTFNDEAEVTQAVSILGQIQQTANQYGDPQTLISQLSSFQQSNNPPESIYGHAVWLSAQTIANAQQIASLLQEGLKDIGEESDPKTRLDDLTQLLTGQGGVSSIAGTLSSAVTAFQTKTSGFYTTLNGQLSGQPNSLQAYLTQKDNVLSDAQSLVSADDDEIKSLNATIHKLNEEYIGFTVAASVSPVFLLIPIFGVVLAVADAATFAALASKVKTELDSLRQKLSGVKKDEQQKTALVNELTSFNLKSQDVSTDGDDFLQTIGSLAAGWGEFQTQIGTRLSSLTVEDVTDWSQFLQKVNFQTALDGWNLIASKAESFYDAGFVKFTDQSSNSGGNS